MFIVIKQKDGGIETIVGVYNHAETAIQQAIEVVVSEGDFFEDERERIESSLRKMLAYGWVNYGSEEDVIPVGEEHSVTIHWVESPTD
jgi:hypothetical protein